jgi:hypothetical protein
VRLVFRFGECQLGHVENSRDLERYHTTA